VQTYRVDGVRIDTVNHSENLSLLNYFSSYLRIMFGGTFGRDLRRKIAYGLLVKCWITGRVTWEATLVSQLLSRGMENIA
jgi:hypothetical protein